MAYSAMTRGTNTVHDTRKLTETLISQISCILTLSVSAHEWCSDDLRAEVVILIADLSNDREVSDHA